MSQSKIALPIIVLLSVIIALASLRFIPLDLELSFPPMQHQFENARLGFLLHISASPIALAIGAYQLLPNMRKRHLTLHRWLGRLYAIVIIVGGVSGFYIAFNIESTIGAIGFALLAVIWVFVTAQAVLKARAKQFADHRIWMIRSFALTFAAVTLRLQLATFQFGFEMPYEQVYPFLAWSCWIPNIIFAQWWISKYPRPIKAST
ncbi:MAG: DUF2306 domain-containing protein [Rhizobiaceae bacterium]